MTRLAKCFTALLALVLTFAAGYVVSVNQRAADVLAARDSCLEVVAR